MKRVTRFLPAILTAALIFVGSSLPGDSLPSTGISDKFLHAGEYCLFALTLMHGARRFWVAVALGLLYAATDEWHQSFVPGRSVEFLDWVADGIGTAGGVLLWRMGVVRRAERVGRGAKPL